MKYTTDILSEIQTWCHYADVVPAYEPIQYGALYNWYAASDVRNITSAGWHIPSNTEAWALQTYLGGEAVSGGKLKEIGTTYWTTPNTGATNEVGFNARGSGERTDSTGNFDALNQTLSFWLSNESGILAWRAGGLLFNSGGFPINSLYSKKQGIPIRPIKDSTILTHGQTGTYTGNDGKVYRTICIGTQEWLADNLAETKYRDGSDIPIVTDNGAWAALITGAMCYYNNDISNA